MILPSSFLGDVCCCYNIPVGRVCQVDKLLVIYMYRNLIPIDDRHYIFELYSMFKFLSLQGTTLFTVLILCLLMLWIMYYLIQKWNDKLIKETLKSAI